MISDERGGGLSPSSMSNYQLCQRRFANAKILNTPKDADTDEDTEALRVGSTFHKCLEDTKHNLTGYGLADVDKVVKEFGLDSGQHTPLLFAMLKRYKQMHDRAGLQAIAFEVPISTPVFYGIVDVILMEPLTSRWYVGDTKTAASFNPSLIPTLLRHPQISLYASHHKELAEKLGLNPEDFAGCRYRLTTKSKIARKASEETMAYVNRLAKVIKSIDFILPKERMSNDAAVMHAAIKAEIDSKQGREELFVRNYSACMNYYRPCPYYSSCHLKTFSELQEIESVSSD